MKPLSTAAVSKIIGKAMKLHKIRKFIIPDENKVTDNSYFKPVCDVCGSHGLKYYRQDLDRHYCSFCYHINRIDLKPVINWS
jgi:hypothetical protein